jgi:hypothetical protein
MFFQIAECILSGKSLVFLHCCAGTMNYDTHFFPHMCRRQLLPSPIMGKKILPQRLRHPLEEVLRKEAIY